MARLSILQYPDPRLKTVAKPVEDFGEATQKVIDDMLETLAAAKNCAALAASQLDLIDPPHVTVINDDGQQPAMTLVNAKITHREGETNTREGCMSVAGGIYKAVKRAETITVEAQDRHGNPLNFEVGGFRAKCIQHELDHLDGKIFLDHLSQLTRRLVDQKIQKALRKRQK